MGVRHELPVARLAKHAHEAQKRYAIGYELDGHRIDEDIALTVWTDSGTELSFEEAYDDTFTLFGLTYDQACKVIDAL